MNETTRVQSQMNGLVSSALLQGSPRVTITSGFWKRYQNIIAQRVLPHQWAILNDEVPVDIPPDPASGNSSDTQYSHAMSNLRIAAGLIEGNFQGYPFQDTDVYKWLEAASYCLTFNTKMDSTSELLADIDELLTVLRDAQSPDGYLDSKIQIDEPDQRFRGLEWSHELYVMGHFIEAAVAHYRSTGERTMLELAIKAARCIDANFGDEEGKIHGPDGHPEVELALVRLYEVTDDTRWLHLAAWFIRIRGVDPDFFEKQQAAGGPQFFKNNELPKSYFQVDGPALEMKSADGHAVRLVYLATAMAKVGKYLNDVKMIDTAMRLWNNIVFHRMYVTGNIGSTQVGESFTYDDDLPNDVDYGETCASVGMAFFAKALMQIRPSGDFADIIETELFNGILAGVQLDGMSYFYVNPLEADPLASCGNPIKKHVLTRRAGWFACACCPSNVARLIASLDSYLYTDFGNTIYAHQFIANRAEFAHGLVIEQKHEGEGFPWMGNITFEVENPQLVDKRIAIRIPNWVEQPQIASVPNDTSNWSLSVNDESQNWSIEDGFVIIDRVERHLTIRLVMNISPRFLQAAPRVKADIGKVCVCRGPVVYCMEEADNTGQLWRNLLDPHASVTGNFYPEELEGVVKLQVKGYRIEDNASQGALYSAYEQGAESPESHTFTMVPYYSWCNRAEGEMAVWFRSCSANLNYL